MAKDQSLLIEYLGDSPLLKILDFFMENPLFDYSREEVLDNVKISKKTLYRVWQRLEEDGLLKLTRKIGKAKMYRLNEENEVVRRLIELGRALADQAMKQAVEREAPKIQV